LCPYFPEITLNNNIEPGLINDTFKYPESSRVGQNFNFVLNYCDVAAKVSKKPYQECEKDETKIE